MKGKIKILSLLLALAMVASMFVACDKTGGDSGKTGGDDKAREEVELIWYHWGDEPKNAKPVEEALNEKSKADIQTTIDFNWATGDDTKLKTLMSTSGEFDIAFTCNWYANFVLAAQGGQLADITNVLPEYAPKLWKDIPEGIWDGARVNGKIYAVPTVKDTAATQYWLVNKEYVVDGAGAGEELKNTGYKLSTVTPLLEKVKAYKDAGTAYPHDLTAPFNYNWNGLLGHENGYDMVAQTVRLGVRMDDANAKVISLYEDPDYIEMVKTLKQWHDNGLVNANATETEKEPEFICVSSAQGWEGAEITAWGLNKDYTVAINKKYGPVLTTASIQGSMNGVGVNSKNIERSVEFLEYINTDVDYRNMLAYGIKDVNWELNDGYLSTLNDEWQPGAFSQATTLILYPVAPAPKDMYAKLKDANNAAQASPLVGFIPDLTTVENEIAACAAIVDANYRNIQTGNLKDAEAKLKEVLNAMNDAGLGKIKETIQSQIDAFLAAK